MAANDYLQRLKQSQRNLKKVTTENKCSLCLKVVKKEDLAEGWNAPMCKSCVRELNHYGSD